MYSPRMRQRIRRQERDYIEAKRQMILMAMDVEARVEHADATYVELVCLRQTGRLNMLPGTEDHG